MTAKKLTAQVKALERAQSALKLGAQQIVTELHNERGKCDLLALDLRKVITFGMSRLTKEERDGIERMLEQHARDRGYKQ